jgi:hypothetical protein
MAENPDLARLANTKTSKRFTFWWGGYALPVNNPPIIGPENVDRNGTQMASSSAVYP